MTTLTSDWLSHWSNWLVQQYQLKDSEQVYTQLQHLADELAQGNSAYFTSQVTMFESACQHQNDLLAHLDCSIHNQKFITQLQQLKPSPLVFDGQAIALYRHWSWELQLAWQLLRMSQSHLSHQHEHLESIVQRLTQLFNLDEYQKTALICAIQHQFSLITGGPGTGKTFILAQVIAVLLQLNPDLRIAMSAPTGKASQRMQEALQNAIKHLPEDLQHPKLNQLQPVTLHRLLDMGMQQKAKFHHHNPLPYDVVVVDEASMLDLNLARLLINALNDNTRLILLGDAHQLASVDVGSVLADMQIMPILQPYHQHLVQSRRFDDKSTIGRIAKFMIEQCFSLPQQYANEAILQHFEQNIEQCSSLTFPLHHHDFAQLCYIDEQQTEQKYYQQLAQGYQPYFDMIQQHQHDLMEMLHKCNQQQTNALHLLDAICQKFDDYRILTAMQIGAFGVEQLNQFIEQKLTTKHNPWYLGKAVMMTYNDYSLGLSNGDVGLCLSQNDDQYGVYFPSLKRWFLASRLPQNMQTAFVMTIHKSQGSEFTHTAVILHPKAERLLSQELIYTGITRAKTQLTLLCTEQSLFKSLTQKNVRHSRLVEKVKKLSIK